MNPNDLLRHYVTGAIERGEAEPIVEETAKFSEQTIRNYARTIAADLIEDARLSDEPVVFVTGNAYVPAFRSFSLAEEVWQNDMDAADDASDGNFPWLVELVEDELSRAEVALEAPDYDNSLYVVDLKRWQYRDPTFSNPNFPSVPDDYSDDLNDEWEPRDQDAVDDHAENPRE